MVESLKNHQKGQKREKRAKKVQFLINGMMALPGINEELEQSEIRQKAKLERINERIKKQTLDRNQLDQRLAEIQDAEAQESEKFNQNFPNAALLEDKENNSNLLLLPDDNRKNNDSNSIDQKIGSHNSVVEVSD